MNNAEVQAEKQELWPIPGSFMAMSFDPCPVHEEIMKQFAVDVSSTLFTFGDILHNPARLNIPPDYVRHEEEHAAQHGHGPEGAGIWWARYFQDPLFRIDQEARAFAAQYDFWCATNRDRNKRAVKLFDLSARLAAPVYGRVVNRQGAQKLIKSFSKTQ